MAASVLGEQAWGKAGPLGGDELARTAPDETNHQTTPIAGSRTSHYQQSPSDTHRPALSPMLAGTLGACRWWLVPVDVRALTSSPSTDPAHCDSDLMDGRLTLRLAMLRGHVHFPLRMRCWPSSIWALPLCVRRRRRTKREERASSRTTARLQTQIPRWRATQTMARPSGW